ncbi:MAG: hypothetical protein RMJ04_06930 [Geminicoccaceae bacterium]|nr:hypothetical protein [Geminicoccaceae bacterium]
MASISFSELSSGDGSRSFLALPFQPVNIREEIRRRRLVERGEADGRSNLPSSDAGAPSSTELEIVNDIRALRERHLNDLASHLRARNDALAQLNTAMDIAQLRNDTEHAISRLGEGDVAWKSEIARLLREAREAKKDYDAFRIEHGLNRAARDPANRFLALSLLCLFVVVESMLNGVFFAEGSEFGLIGGTTLAFGISLVNVCVFGFCLGIGPARWQHHRSSVLRVVARALLAAGLALVVFANAFVAHYRDMFEHAGEAVLLSEVWARLRDDPFGLARLQSWLLFFLGLLFAGLGFWKGYRFDDPYPGYGRVARRWQQAEQRYLESRHRRLEEASRVRDDAKHAIDRAIERLRGAALQREQILGARARWVQEFEAHERHLEEVANALLAAYRDANRRVRTTPPPPYFDALFFLRRPRARAAPDPGPARCAPGVAGSGETRSGARPAADPGARRLPEGF